MQTAQRYSMRYERGAKQMKHTDHTLCWHCRHAVPTKDKITGEYLTGCAWSIAADLSRVGGRVNTECMRLKRVA